MLDDVAGERHRQVIAEPLLANRQGQGLAVVGLFAFRKPECIVIDAGKGISGIQDAEKEFVPLVAVFPQQGGEVLHRGRLDLGIAEGLEDGLDRIENIVPFGRFLLTEITGSLWNGRFLCHRAVQMQIL